MTKKRFAVTLVLALVAIASAMVAVGISGSAKGLEIYALEKEIDQIQKENRKITSEIVERTSLTDLLGEAEDLGYTKPENILYLDRDTSVAQAPR